MGVPKTKIIVYASTDCIAKAKAARMPIDKLNALYGTDKTAIISQKFAELHLFPGTVMRIANSLIYRNEKGLKADIAIQKIEDLGYASSAFQQLICGMQALEGKFLAMFSAEQIEQATHHSLSHGVDMSHDPSDFIAPILEMKNDTLTPAALLVTVTLHALGAAHDIVQGKQPPPTNEIESAEWFCIEMRSLLDGLMQRNQNIYSENEIEALSFYKEDAVPFLARECIINATYMLFASGKRDFDNVLMQVSEIYLGDAIDLAPMIAAMKIGLAISDTRRGEMDHLLEKMESLKIMIERGLGAELDKLLRAAEIFTVNDQLPSCSADLKNLSPLLKVKCENAEGFLLRLRPSMNMAIELAKTAKLDEMGKPMHDAAGALIKVPDPMGVRIIHQLRRGQEPGVNYSKRVNHFLAKINDKTSGEITFANELGAINQELVDHAERYGIGAIMTNNRLRSNWKHQGAMLTTLKHNLDAMDSSEKAAIAELMYTMAAISPGIVLGMGMTQEIYDGMVAYEQELFQLAVVANKLNNLSRDIDEIEILNANTLRLAKERLAIGRTAMAQSANVSS